MGLSKKEIATLLARKTLQASSSGFPNVSELHQKSFDNRTLMHGSDYRANPEDKSLIDKVSASLILETYLKRNKK